MKKFFALTLCVLSLTLHAQNPVFNNPNNHRHFGVRASFDLSVPSDFKEGPVSFNAFGTGAGFSFEGIYHIPLVANLYLEPGIGLYYNTYSINKELLESVNQMDNMSGSMRKFGMRVPVLVGYHFDLTSDFRIFATYGFVFEEGFTAKSRITQKSSSSSLSSSTSAYGDGGMPRFDLLTNLGAGIEYRHLHFGVSGNLGTLNLSGDSDVQFYENVVKFTVGYNF